tara:strand:+ start:6662 stop:6868 length:207 start_codon:yes stop_codon:yes gene_type:complete
MIVQLTPVLIQLVNTGKCKAVDIISFLLDNGFTCDKESNKASLQELMFKNQSITQVTIDSKGNAHIKF